MFNSPFRDTSGDALPLSRPSSNEGDIAILRGEVERLLMITEALWRILRDQQGLDETELVKQITMLDLEDGKLDGRKPPTPPKPCPKCQRILARHRPRCLFCGEPIASDPFER